MKNVSPKFFQKQSNKQVAGLIPDLLIDHVEKLRAQTLDLERRLEKEKKRLQRHTDDLKNYHHLQNSSNASSFPSKLQQQHLAGVDDGDGESCSEQSLNNTQDSDFGGRQQPQQLQHLGSAPSSATEPIGSSNSRRKLSYQQSTNTAPAATSDKKSKHDRYISFDNEEDHDNSTPHKTRLERGSDGDGTIIQANRRKIKKKKRINSQSKISIAAQRQQHHQDSSSGSCDSDNEFDDEDDDDDDDDDVEIKEEEDVFKRPTNIPTNLILSSITKNVPTTTRRKMSHQEGNSTKSIAVVGSLTNADSQINNVKRTQSW